MTKAVSYYGTATKVAQLLPIIFGLLVVALTPNAWLSETLRRWSIWGMLAGGGVGAVAFYLASSRRWSFKWIARWMLVVLVAAAAMLRLHLAVADVQFTEQWRIFRGVHDFFVGTGDFQEQLYNVLAAFWFALTLFAATLGLPALGLTLAEERNERAKSGNPALESGFGDYRESITRDLNAVFRALDSLELENRALRAKVEEQQRLIQQFQEERPVPQRQSARPD